MQRKSSLKQIMAQIQDIFVHYLRQIISNRFRYIDHDMGKIIPKKNSILKPKDLP